VSRLRSRRGQRRPPALAIVVDEPMWRSHSDLIMTIRQAATLALQAHSVRADHEHHRRAASVLLSGDARLKELNAAFRKKPNATNVLSFPAVPALSPYIGDVALAYGVLRGESAAQNKSLAAHAAHLTIHGILHLLGYQHDRPKEAKAMENLEILLLGKLGIADPYMPAPVRRRAKQPKLAVCPRVPAR